MSRLLLVLSAGMLAAGCGGGHGRRLGRPATPVAEQVRQALLGALTGPAIGSLPAQRAQLPYRDVTRCTGPAAGGAGLYRCATVPRGARGIRSLDVQVMASGQWSSRPVPVEVTFRGRRSSAVTGLWGFGIRLPG